MMKGPQPGFEQQWQAYQTVLARQQGLPAPEPLPATPALTPPAPIQAVPEQPISIASTRPQPTRNRKKGLLAVATAALVVLAASTYTFAFYLPSRPENVWNTGLGNTGHGLSMLTSKLASPDSLSAFDAYSVDGTFKASLVNESTSPSGRVTIGGSVSLKANSATTNASVKASAATNGQTTTLGLNLITTTPQTGSYPDSYVQVNGLDATGIGGLLPGLAEYNGKWISVPGSFLQQELGAKDTTADTLNDQPSVTKTDVANYATSMVSVIGQDILNSNQSQSILQRKSFVGYAKKNDRDSYHYTATVNQARVAAFCNDLVKASATTVLYKKLGGTSDDTSGAIDSCKEFFTQNFPASKTLGVWMDSASRSLAAIRFNPGSKTGEYLELGQILGNTNNPGFYLTSGDSSGTGTVKLTVDTSSHASTFDISYTGTNTSSFTAHATLAPYTGTLKVTAPETDFDISEIIAQLLPSLTPPSDGSDSTGTDPPADASTDTTDPSLDPTSTDSTDAAGVVTDSATYDPTTDPGTG